MESLRRMEGRQLVSEYLSLYIFRVVPGNIHSIAIKPNANQQRCSVEAQHCPAMPGTTK